MTLVDTKKWATRSLLGALLLILLAAPTDLLAQERALSFSDVQRLGASAVMPAPDQAPVVRNLPAASKTAALTFYTSRATFEAAFPALATEDFEGSKIGPLNVCSDLTPLTSATDDACYATTAIVDGYLFDTDGLQGPPIDYALITDGFLGASGSWTGPNTFGDNAIHEFTGVDPVFAAGFDVGCPINPGTLDVDVYGTSGYLGTTSINCSDFPGVFVGVSSDGEAITRLETFDTGSGAAADLFNDVVFGGVLEADLSVYKDVDYDASTNTGSYHIEVENLGSADATGVYAIDTLPNAITITGWGTTQGTFDPFSGHWDIGDMANGAIAELWIDVTFNAQGRYTNSVDVGANEDDPDPYNNYDEVSIIKVGDRIVPDFVPGSGAGGTISRGDRFLADLLLDKSVDNAAPAVGDDIEYTITVLNQGPQSTAKVEATDVLPACLAFSGSSADRGSYDDGSGIWAIGDLKVGETVTLTITTTVTDACSGEVINTAEVTNSSLPDPDDQFNLFDEEPVEDEIDSASINITARKLTLDGTTFALGTNYPNPFNPTTLIPFSVAEASEVSIKVYDLLGRTVATLVDGTLSAGVHEVQFEASQLPTGMYIVRMEAAGIVKTQRVTLMK